MDEPSTNGGQTAGGRAAGGKFAPGNPGGPGNPNAAHVNRHRAALLKAIRAKDITLAVETILDVMAKGKDSDRLAAARELIDRVCGKAVQSELLERIEKLEAERRTQ